MTERNDVTRPLLLDLFCGAGGAAKGYHDMAAALRRILDLRDSWAEVPAFQHAVERLDAALAGTQTDDGYEFPPADYYVAPTQTDDGAGPEPLAHSSAPSSPDLRPLGPPPVNVAHLTARDEALIEATVAQWPAPSSPDRIEAVAQALRGGPWTYQGMAEAAVAALDAYDREHEGALGKQAHDVLVHEVEADLRERIAADIEAINTGVGHTTTCGCHPCRVKQDAARIARGGQS